MNITPSHINEAHLTPESPFKIAVIGLGNWGSTIAKVLAENASQYPKLFVPEVDMWVFEEIIDGDPLSGIINTKHENVKYLPGVKLPENLIAKPSLLDVAADADLLVFNLPHQFLLNICAQLLGNIKPYARGISCLKGLDVSKTGCKLLSTAIEEKLNITCGALLGANLALEVAEGKWSETTIAYKIPNDFRGPGKDIDKYVLKAAFHRPYFHVNIVDDLAGVSVAGALKNVVALAVGFVEGLGWGENSKAAIMRIGLMETINFSHVYFPKSKNATFTEESAGVADLITTCNAGRNHKVGKYMAENNISAKEAERILLNGQSSQGIITAEEVHELVQNTGHMGEFPLFEAVYQIIFGNEAIENLPALLDKGVTF